MVCELSIVILYTSSDYLCFTCQFSYWIPRNSFTHSAWVYKVSWMLFRHCGLNFVFTELSECTATYSKKSWVGWDGRSRHPSNMNLCLHSALQANFSSPHLSHVSPWVCSHSLCLAQSTPRAPARHLGNRDSPRQSFLTSSWKIQYTSTLSEF